MDPLFARPDFQALSGFDKLLNLNGIFVKQKIEPFEIISGCQTENKYLIFPLTDSFKPQKSTLLFKAKEKSATCQRICLPSDCREFQMKV